MNREEQIKQAAYAQFCNDSSITFGLLCEAFAAGAMWADAHPWSEGPTEEWLNKACKWLDTHVSQYAMVSFIPDSDYPQGDVAVESLIKAFKQAMENE